MMMLPEERRAETAHAFGLWRAARSKHERNKHLVRLWELCGPEIARALQDIAAPETSVEVWLERRNLSFDEIADAAYLAVVEAARRYDPDHVSGASFPTFVMKYIKGEVSRLSKDSPPHAGPEKSGAGPERQPQEELHPEEERLDLADIVALVRKHRKADIMEKIYQLTKYPDEYPSKELRRIADVIKEEFAEGLEQDAKAQALHSNLIVMSVRAEDYEGQMVNIGTLSNILAVREYRRAEGMPKESYSPKVLARVFGKPSDKTLAKWLEECDKQGITAENWTPEQLAKIISSRRGPKFRGRRELPASRPKE